LTVVAHELGHILGYEDSGADGLMAEYLGPGTRRLPTSLETGTQAGVKSNLPSLSPHLRAFIKDPDIPVAIATTPGIGNMGMLPGVGGTVIVAAPLQPDPPVRGWEDKKSSKWIPGDSALQAKPFSKHALDAVFANLDGRPLLADGNNTVA
jgi:hypothetical protein